MYEIKIVWIATTEVDTCVYDWLIKSERMEEVAQPATVVAGTTGECAALASVRWVCLGSASLYLEGTIG